MPELFLAGLLVFLLGCGSEEGPSRLIVLGLDGVDPDVVDRLVGEGKLPNFSRLAREGAHGPLAVDPPLLSPILWTTAATGKFPAQHGIAHFTTVDPETGEELPITSSLRRTKALWNIFSEREKKVAVVGWWATWPAEPVRGAMVSDHLAYHFLLSAKAAGKDPQGEGLTHPPELAAAIAPQVRKPETLSHQELARFLDLGDRPFAGALDFADPVDHFRWALAAALTHRNVALKLWSDERPDLLMVYVEAVDTTSHLFGHLFGQEQLAGELAEQQARFGRSVEEIYRFADELVGEFLALRDERTTLVVLSDHGFELGALPEDPSKTRDLRRVSEKYHREHGILYLAGPGVRAASRLKEAGMLDVAPTILALGGLPPAADMPGRVLEEALVVPQAQARIASYESEAAGAAPLTRDSATDEAMLEKLRSLGYLADSSSPAGGGSLAPTASKNDRNLAAIALREGRFEEAAAAFQRLAAETPRDPKIQTGLATALGELGRREEALAAFSAALAADPLFVSAYFNRGLLFDRAGRRAEAVADYRNALRCDAHFGPARAALERLGESAGPVISAAAEIDAARKVQEAGALARRGDYSGARRLLEEARQLAPAMAAVYQALSNVAYLEGDLAAAIAALEKAAALEPDNVLFQENLRRLRRRLDAGAGRG